MKKLLGFCMLVALTLAAWAVEDGQVVYIGGTVSALKEGAIGSLDTSSEKILALQAAGGKLVIPYAGIESYQYSHELARHLGVLPAIGVGLVRRRQQRHYFRITYRDESGASQVAVLEVSKHAPPILLAILHSRAPQGSKATASVARQ